MDNIIYSISEEDIQNSTMSVAEILLLMKCKL